MLRSINNEKISGVVLWWKIFGDSGIKVPDNRFVIERFIYHADLSFSGNKWEKTICKLKNTSHTSNVHNFSYFQGFYGIDSKFVKYNRDSGPQWENYWLNHYKNKTREEFILRMKKGNAINNLPRDSKSFEHHNRNDIYDDSMRKYIPIVKEIIRDIRN